jgi:hypothetical protein
MKPIISQSFAKQSLLGSALMTIFTVGLIGSFIVSINLPITGSQFGNVLILLVRLGFKLIPPALWIGAVLIVALWLAAMVRVWRQQVS